MSGLRPTICYFCYTCHEMVVFEGTYTNRTCPSCGLKWDKHDLEGLSNRYRIQPLYWGRDNNTGLSNYTIVVDAAFRGDAKYDWRLAVYDYPVRGKAYKGDVYEQAIKLIKTVEKSGAFQQPLTVEQDQDTGKLTRWDILEI